MVCIKLKKTYALLIILICIGNLFPNLVNAAEVLLMLYDFEPMAGDKLSVSFDVKKTTDESFGLSFTSSDDGVSSGLTHNYSSNGMIRLSKSNELVISKPGNWISEENEDIASAIRVPFQKNTLHNIRAEHIKDETKPVVNWYLDDEFIGTTSANNNMSLTALSVFGENASGIEITDFSVTNSYTKDAGTEKSTYQAAFSNTQGVNGWYFSEFYGSNVKNLLWNSEKGLWNGVNNSPRLSGTEMVPELSDVGYTFVVPEEGVVRISGEITMPYADSKKGDGVSAYICKGDKTLFKGDVKYGSDTSYDITVPVKKYEKLYFKINKKSNSYFDWVSWFPSVTYTDVQMSGEKEEFTYFEVTDSGYMPLYLSGSDTYETADGTSSIGRLGFNVANNKKLVRGYSVPKSGRYRVYVDVAVDGSNGMVVDILKNGESCFKQYIPPNTSETIDFRMFADKDDSIEVLIEGENGAHASGTWNFDVIRYVGTLFSYMTPSAGFNYLTDEEFTLSSKLKTTDAEVYQIKNDISYPMAQSTSWWTSSIPDNNGYVSPYIVNIGNEADTYIEYTVENSGLLRIEGAFDICESSDGAVVKAYKNNELLWSNRIGGERPVRWDEPFDVSYFLNEISVIAEVKEGDILKFSFDQWRKAENDGIGISDIKLKYVKGDVISETTKWKLSKSSVIDIEKKTIETKGTEYKIDVFSENGTIYILKDDILKLLGENADIVRSGRMMSEKEYLPLQDIVEDNNKNIAVVSEELAVIYDGIPSTFSYPEISETKVLYSGSGIIEANQLSIVDAKGKTAKYFTGGVKYYIKAQADNYIGGDMPLIILVAQYDAKNSLIDLTSSGNFIAKSGESFVLNGNSGTDKVEFTVSDDMDKIKVFMWSDYGQIKPIAIYEK